MSLTDASGLSASDVLALTANNDGFGGNGFGGGFGGGGHSGGYGGGSLGGGGAGGRW
jgi:uncharacterized protein